MERYLQRKRLADVLDGLGARALILLTALALVVGLWGLHVPALMAGTALGVLGMQLRTQRRRRTVARREQALRRSLVAELMLEDMLLSEPKQAHFQAALLLAERWPLTLQQAEAEGVLCRQGAETLLVQCVRVPPEGALSAGDLLAAVRALRRTGADRAVLCVLGKIPPRMAARAEQLPARIRLVPRETLLPIAAAVSPATDEQLVQLGHRRRQTAARGGIAALVFRRDKARRYYGYGVLMLALYVLSGMRLYAVTGMVCLTMAVLSRISRQPDTL